VLDDNFDVSTEAEIAQYEELIINAILLNEPNTHGNAFKADVHLNLF
jgi:hypothetical protein